MRWLRIACQSTVISVGMIMSRPKTSWPGAGGLEHCVDGAAECEGGDLEEVIVVRWGVAGKFKVHELVSDILVYDPVGAFEDGVGLGVANGGGLWFDAV